MIYLSLNRNIISNSKSRNKNSEDDYDFLREKEKLPVPNELAAEQCGASWLNKPVMTTKMETKFKYKIC